MTSSFTFCISFFLQGKVDDTFEKFFLSPENAELLARDIFPRFMIFDGLPGSKEGSDEKYSIRYPIIIIIWSKMAQLGLEESFEVEGFRRPK